MTFAELEKKCKKRRFVRFFIIIFLLIALIGASFFAYKIFLKSKASLNAVNHKKLSKKIKISKKHKIVPAVRKEKKPIVKQTKLKYVLDINSSKYKIKKKKTIKKTEHKKIKKTKHKKVIKKTNNITVNRHPEVLKAIPLPSYGTCIALSKKYYQLKKYGKALKWAKNANIQNKKLPDSWIMSAKALYAMGKREEALKILKIYYNYQKNEKVKKLMGEMDENK